ncbi:hypothetical protein Tco_0777816 [Tanacetum coccineum]
MSTIDRSSMAIKDLYQGLNVITKLLKDISNAVKDDPAINKKINEATETFAKISTNTTKVLFLVKDFIFSTLQTTMNDLQAHALKQEEASASWTKSSTNMAWNLSSRMTAIEISQTALKRENATNTATKEPPSHTKGETKEPKMAILISSIQPTKVPPTQAQPITTITTHPESSQAALRIDKGKGIATESNEEPSKKLVPTSTIVCLDPDEEVKVPYLINRKMCYLTDKEMQAYLDKEEKLRKADEEARLLAISKPEVIKVVQEEAEKIRLDPKKVASAKADLMISLSKRYERLKKIPKELGIQSALPAPLVMASMVKTEENARFSLKLKKLIDDHPDQEKLKSKRVKLEALRYQID